MARLSAFTSSEANEPTGLPRRLLGTAVNLSTIIRHGARSPLSALGWMDSLKIGAGVGSVVKGHTTIESFASNRSSWTMTAGRGLPAWAPPPATVQISPRFIRHSRQKPRRRTTGPAWRGDSSPPPVTDDVPLGRRTGRNDRGCAYRRGCAASARSPSLGWPSRSSRREQA